MVFLSNIWRKEFEWLKLVIPKISPGGVSGGKLNFSSKDHLGWFHIDFSILISRLVPYWYDTHQKYILEFLLQKGHNEPTFPNMKSILLKYKTLFSLVTCIENVLFYFPIKLCVSRCKYFSSQGLCF